jgi:hypothetical protein
MGGLGWPMAGFMPNGQSSQLQSGQSQPNNSQNPLQNMGMGFNPLLGAGYNPYGGIGFNPFLSMYNPGQAANLNVNISNTSPNS